MKTSLQCALALVSTLAAASASAEVLRVMRQGLGDGTVTSDPPGIDCRPGGRCDFDFPFGAVVTLTMAEDASSRPGGWNVDPDAVGPSTDCTPIDARRCRYTASSGLLRSVRAKFDRAVATEVPDITAAQLDAITPEELEAYLDPTTGPGRNITTTAEFIAALPDYYRQGWMMMTRSESLQTGTSRNPRLILASHTAKSVFTFALAAEDDASYPSSHHAAIEYMQWDETARDFRFHEIRVRPLPDGRGRGVTKDDVRCTKCHSTRNVKNTGWSPGTDGDPMGIVLAKNKPNWDTYDSWAGLLGFNRDRIYRGSVEAAAYRQLLNPWTWSNRPDTQRIIEQLRLQPNAVPRSQHVVRRVQGGLDDGKVMFMFDGVAPPALEENARGAIAYVSYAFDRVARTMPTSPIYRADFTDSAQLYAPDRDGNVSAPGFVLPPGVPGGVGSEGRGVELFDRLFALNQRRIGHEVAHHKWATGSVPFDPRPLALAIRRGCLTTNGDGILRDQTGAPFPLSTDVTDFFTQRTAMVDPAFPPAPPLNMLFNDTENRQKSMPRRKADLQRHNLDRSADPYAITPASRDGLIQAYGALTRAGTTTSVERIRQEVFQRQQDLGVADRSEVNGFYVDREEFDEDTGRYSNTGKITLYRYFLEPLGVSVDKWSTAVRGRSRTYTFADLLNGSDVLFHREILATYAAGQERPDPALKAAMDTADMLDARPDAGRVPTCPPELMNAVTASFGALPDPNQVPKYTDVQRIFNKACIECHGGLGYPPYTRATGLDLSEDTTAAAPIEVLERAHLAASDRLFVVDAATGRVGGSLWSRITSPVESDDCTTSLMPCGGPPLSKTDIETIRRWVLGRELRTVGDPHLKTIDGVQYDFQGAGEFVLYRDVGIEVQTRHMPVATQSPVYDAYTDLNSCASLTTGVAIRVGPHRITYQQQPGQQQPVRELRLNGKVITLGSELPLSGGGRIQVLPTAGLQVETPGGTLIQVTSDPWPYYGVYFMNVNIVQGRGTEGLIGRISPGNWLPALPDGTLLGARPALADQRYHQLYETFEEAWRVTAGSSLFDYEPGTSTASYAMPGWPPKHATSCSVVGAPPGVVVKPALKPLPLNVAQQYCSPVVEPALEQNCMFDVAATGDPAWVNAYLALEVSSRNRAPAGPVLLDPADDGTSGNPGTFKWKPAVDPDGHAVTYRLCIWPVEESFTFGACGAPTTSLSATQWLVKGKDYFWKVLAEDGRGRTGHSDTRRLAIR